MVSLCLLQPLNLWQASGRDGKEVGFDPEVREAAGISDRGC